MEITQKLFFPQYPSKSKSILDTTVFVSAANTNQVCQLVA